MRAASPAVPLFVAASLGAFAGLSHAWPVVPLALGVACALLGVMFARSAVARAALLIALVFALAMTGAAVEVGRHAERRAALPSSAAVFDGVVDDVWFGRRGPVVSLAVSGALVDGQARPLSATLAVHLPDGSPPPPAGARLRVRGFAAPLAPSFSPGAFDDLALGLARGIDARLHVHAEHDVAVLAGAADPRAFAAARVTLRERLRSQLTPREAGLLLALLIGDTSLIDDEERAIYRAAGAGHLLAVSGLQVTLLAVVLARLALSLVLLTPFGRKGRGPALAGLVALAGVWGFVLLCGAPPSAVRAGAMGSAVLLAGLLGRRASTLDALGVAGLFTVLLAPASVIDPSFLLSYAAVIGLVAATTTRAPVEDASPALLTRLGAGALVAVGAGVATVPVSAFLFGQLAPAGLVANIVLVPAASILQVPALVGGALGAALEWPTLSFLGAQAALLLEALTAGLADLLPGMRLVEAPSGAVALALFALALVAVGAAVRRAWLPALAAAALALALVATRDRDGDGARITVLPVGQGDCAVLELPDGTALVIDGGPGDRVDQGAAGEVVLPFLSRRGIERVDVMVLSHPHPDHGGGLAAVARMLPVGELWLTDTGGEEDGVAARVLGALGPGTRVRTTPELLGVHRFGDSTIEVLAPAPAERTATYPELSANDNSLVLRVCHAGSCALWPGDIEALGEEQLLATGADVRAPVVKAPHHGSSTSSIPAFVERVGARHVVFCTGPGNQFGFPAAPVLERWRAAGAHLWDTAVNGQITVVLGKDGVRLRAHRDGQVVPGSGSARR